MGCIVDGLSYKMIAANMNISYETVRSHVKKIYEKLRVASLTEVVAKPYISSWCKLLFVLHTHSIYHL
jgi:DNA-binding NarL/FixJ family response regulator